MDDLDVIAGQRGQTQPHRLREFLNVMDGGLADRAGVVVASTNDHRKIDKAAQRSSRFDTVIRLEAPGFERWLAILRRACSPRRRTAHGAATPRRPGCTSRRRGRNPVFAN